MGFDVHIIGDDKEGVGFGIIACIVMIVPLRVEKHLGATFVEVEEVDVPYFLPC